MKHHVTRVLIELAEGRQQANEVLFALVYAELRRIAAWQIAHRRAGQALRPTMLVHEAYLKLMGPDAATWSNRGHFFSAAARAMREIIVDHVRRQAATRPVAPGPEGGPASIAPDADDRRADEVLAVHAALQRLEVDHPRKAQIVVMRYFGGLSDEEIAGALDLTTQDVERAWRFARAYLHDVIKGHES